MIPTTLTIFGHSDEISQEVRVRYALECPEPRVTEIVECEILDEIKIAPSDLATDVIEGIRFQERLENHLLKLECEVKTSRQPLEFHGYTIEKETEPWARKYGFEYRYYNDERVHHAKTIACAKEEIMERLLESPRHTVTLKGRAPYKFCSFIDALEFAIMFNAEDYQLEY